ncbi:winged helix-turn-helix domain-containing protein [Streptomyces sp. NPDC015661]|uniref:helix-turn-helix domain-containing protein n=1 Tax=Streptomyces sp. NPDC015661 TaxID=3364961 RepID=UPI0036F88FF8
MLRIHFTPEDFARIRVVTNPDPFWEIVCSLHRLQTSQGRWAYADWFRGAWGPVSATPLGRAVRRLLVPLVPRAAYFPDFLTPYEAMAGMKAGAAAILDTPASRIDHELRLLDGVSGTTAWARGLVAHERRRELLGLLCAYHEAVIAPYQDHMAAGIAGERAVRGRQALDSGVHGLLAALTTTARWRPPVLELDYVVDRDLRLDGRGLCLVPSYFCWRTPIALAEDSLPPVLVYPLHDTRRPEPDCPSDASLCALLGRTRAAALQALALGATTSELARRLGVSPATAAHHTGVLRDAGLITTRRSLNTVLHTLTPVGAALLRR